MKLKDNKELRGLSDTDLKKECELAEKELYLLSMKLSLGELKQTHLVKTLRRYVASIKTVATEKNITI